MWYQKVTSLRIEEVASIADLHQLGVFDLAARARLYDETRSGYLQMRACIRMLDYLRLLVLEYLQME